ELLQFKLRKHSATLSLIAGSSDQTVSSFPTGLLCPHFPFTEIQTATQDFNEKLLIGQGGFGKVYKGTMKNATRTIVAIKRLDSSSAQGATEFWAEVDMLSMLRHCNLVSLIGYCNENKEMILVYEYISNGTLEDHLHKLRTPLSWLQRLKICIGAARALHYLHTGTGTQQGVIHRDVKSSNILLDKKWVAKLSDFGLSKISPIDTPLTFVNTLIKGTFGYFDPEYFFTGRLTRKSDVFSFGVILLEVLCRKRAVDKSLDDEQWGLVGWAQHFLRGGNFKEIVDPDLRGQVLSRCLNDYAKIVDGCLHSRPKLRMTMAEVVFGLESILSLQEKSDILIPQLRVTTFGRKLQKYFFSSKQNSDTRYDDSDTPDNILGELVAVGWPSWLAAVAGEALKGWLPRRADTFLNLGEASHFIGEGSYSVVYKAKDISTGNIVALKKIQCDTSDPESVKMIAMEIAILRRLDHPNVIKFEGIVTSTMSEFLYLVFEYMDHDLATLSAKPGTEFTVPQVKHYMHQLISGLKHCHDKQVLHRDIKGSDLLLDNNGVLKIADFGSASFVDLILEHPMTNNMATFWYRAPELLLGATEYGVGVDLWSAGCILAGLLANKPILDGHTEAEQLQKIYALCGSPTDEYWKTYKLPLETLYKPQQQFERRIFFSEISQVNQSQVTEMEAIGSTASNTTSRLGEQKGYVKRSVVWNHFTDSVKNDGKLKCRCTYCALEYECASTIEATLTLTNHMKSCASNPANQTQTRRKLTSSAAKIEETSETKVSLLSWRFDQQVAGKALIEVIVTDTLPFKFVENEGFRRHMRLCQPAFVIPSRSIVTTDCYELYLDEKAKLKAQLNKSTMRVCLTIDTWTSLQRINYMCLSAHFIDNNWKLQKRVINFSPISSRRESDIGRAVELCLVDWGLQNIFTITVDNASTNDITIEYLKSKFVRKDNLCVLKGKWTHVRSITRVINLVVQDVTKEMGSSVDSVRAAVRYVSHSPARLKKFKEFAKLEKIECQKSLCLDVPTRWNSTLLMLTVALTYCWETWILLI
ncbi:mitogen-activated protein kinase, conserved site-containing protein, partial [Tanacetum coccineum]